MRILLAVLAIILALAAVAGISREYQLESEAGSLAGIEAETGAQLPSDVRVLNTDVRWLTIADGTNYEWLLSGSSSLIPWAEANAQLEGPGVGGWSHVKWFSELSRFDAASLEELGLHSVWRVVMRNAIGTEKTSYLFVASDQRTALLQTFRP